MKNAITDFGAKIGGARKDAWAVNGLKADDLADMTDAEKITWVCKDNVWPRPDWISLVQNGHDKMVCFWQNEMRKAVSPKPHTFSDDALCNYVDGVERLMDAVMDVRTTDQIFRFYKDFIAASGMVQPLHGRFVTIPERYRDVINKKVLKMSQLSSTLSLQRIKGFTEFGVPKDQVTFVLAKAKLHAYQYDGLCASFLKEKNRPTIQVKYGYGSSYFYPDGIFAEATLWKPDTWFVVDMSSRRVLSYNLDSEEIAESTLNAIAQKDLDSNEGRKRATRKAAKSQFRFPQIDWTERVGRDWRGNMPTDCSDFLNVLKFSGGEFGNWLSDAERQQNLDYAYDAFRDLAFILGMEPASVSLDGTLSIAFGARGKGGVSAASAHYEPMHKVINLTRLKGAGCLAHEWGHALDHYLTHVFAENSRSRAFLFSEKDLSMKLASELPLSAFPEVFQKLIRMLEMQNGNVTRYYTDSLMFDKEYRKSGHGYWASRCELFARAFDCYLVDKLAEAGMKDDYLTAYADSFTLTKDGKTYCAYPTGEERKRINEGFDCLFQQLKALNVL